MLWAGGLTRQSPEVPSNLLFCGSDQVGLVSTNGIPCHGLWTWIMPLHQECPPSALAGMNPTFIFPFSLFATLFGTHFYSCYSFQMTVMTGSHMELLQCTLPLLLISQKAWMPMSLSMSTPYLESSLWKGIWDASLPTLNRDWRERLLW